MLDLTDGVFFRPVRDWFDSNLQHQYYTAIDDNGRQLIDFRTKAAQKAFLEAFPKWKASKPDTWFDNPEMAGKVPLVRERRRAAKD